MKPSKKGWRVRSEAEPLENGVATLTCGASLLWGIMVERFVRVRSFPDPQPPSSESRRPGGPAAGVFDRILRAAVCFWSVGILKCS